MTNHSKQRDLHARPARVCPDWPTVADIAYVWTPACVLRPGRICVEVAEPR